jgi:hypothetical protein
MVVFSRESYRGPSKWSLYRPLPWSDAQGYIWAGQSRPGRPGTVEPYHNNTQGSEQITPLHFKVQNHSINRNIEI